MKPINIAIIAGASAGVLLIVGIILTAVCLCRRKKKLPKANLNTGAHDNPTYMASGQVARVPEPQGAEGNREIQVPEGVYDELPHTKQELMMVPI